MADSSHPASPSQGDRWTKLTIVAALALACLDGGATALRIESIDNVKAVRAVTDVPIIGLVKRDLNDSPIRITPFIKDVLALIHAGADIVAFDATDRTRPVTVLELIAATHGAGAISMADCASYEDGVHALNHGVNLIGTTLAGYVDGNEPETPDLELVSALAKHSPNVIAEGCYRTPEQAAQAIARGACAVVAGSAITRPEHIACWFSQSVATHFAKREAD